MAVWRRRQSDHRSEAKRYAPPPGERVYAVGDIHGYLEPLEALLSAIERDMADAPGPVHIVFLGDYIDRGPQSAAVIDRLLAGVKGVTSTHHLKGNHEAALMAFIADPTAHLSWFEWGGYETLVSYGLDPAMTPGRMPDWSEIAAMLAEAMPQAHHRFFQSLPLMHRIGNYVFVHAGIRPGIALGNQDPADLLMIREEFWGQTYDPGFCVVHGHTPKQTAEITETRINVDTGVYFTGRLTAVVLQDGTARLLSNLD